MTKLQICQVRFFAVFKLITSDAFWVFKCLTFTWITNIPLRHVYLAREKQRQSLSWVLADLRARQSRWSVCGDKNGAVGQWCVLVRVPPSARPGLAQPASPRFSEAPNTAAAHILDGALACAHSRPVLKILPMSALCHRSHGLKPHCSWFCGHTHKLCVFIAVTTE